MANAKKCDICKKLYETPVCNDVVRVHIDYGSFGDRYVDLCDDCYSRLCDFLKPTLPKDNSFKRQSEV